MATSRVAVEWQLPARWRRLVAWAIDVVLLAGTAGIAWIYVVVALWPRGLTPGKKVLGLVVIGTDTRTPADRRRMAERALIHRNWARFMGLASFGAGYVYTTAFALGPQRRTSYDDWSRTLVAHPREAEDSVPQ